MLSRKGWAIYWIAFVVASGLAIVNLLYFLEDDSRWFNMVAAMICGWGVGQLIAMGLIEWSDRRARS